MSQVKGKQNATPLNPNKIKVSTQNSTSEPLSLYPSNSASSTSDQEETTTDRVKLNGEHYNIKNLKQLGLEDGEDQLGSGRFSLVVKSTHIDSQKIVAHKKLRSYYETEAEKTSLTKRKERLQIEVQILKKLYHKHIVKLAASYVCVDEQALGLILEPVASQGHLGDKLRGELSPDDSNFLQSSLGCLTAVVAFIHQEGIRHKDIKPDNILCHNGTLILCDFGISHDANLSNDFRMTTGGNAGYFPRGYDAPEIREGTTRNEKTDIFALGCVFIDILSALKLIKLDTDASKPYIIENLKDITNTTKALQEYRFNPQIQCIVALCSKMISIESKDRPSAKTVALSLKGARGKHYFCQECFDNTQEEVIWYSSA